MDTKKIGIIVNKTIPLAFIFLLGLIIFAKIFQLEVYGDELISIWYVKASLITHGVYNIYAGYRPYELSAIALYYLYEFSNHNSTFIYFFTYLLRFLAVVALYIFLARRGVNKLACFLGAVLFMITPIGMQNTDWARNAVTYLSIALIFLEFDLILNLNSWKKCFFLLVTFFILIFTNPVRAHGAIISTALILILLFILASKKFKKYYVIASVSIFGALLFLLNTEYLGAIQTKSYFYHHDFLPTLDKISKGDQQLFFALFGSIGNGTIANSSLFLFIPFIIFLFVWKSYLLSKKYITFTLLLQTAVIILGFILQVYSKKLFPVFVGIYANIFFITAMIIEIKDRKWEDVKYTVLCLCLLGAFLILPWFSNFSAIIESTHRYLIYTALVLPITVSLALTKKKSLWLYGSAIILIIISLIFARNEVDNYYFRHNQETARTIWKQIMPYFKNHDFKNGQLLIFATSNGSEGLIHDSVQFGMGYKIALFYDIWDDKKLPVIVDSLTDFKSLMTDGKAGEKYGLDKIIPKENAFYFELNGTKITRRFDY